MFNIFVSKIRKIRGSGNNEVSYCPERGGIITSLKLNGEEIFYFDEKTFKNKKENIRGGIPILFPNAGELTDNKEFPNLKRHGFARNMKWKDRKTENGFEEILVSSKKTKKSYPYNFEYRFSGEFENDSSFTLTSEIVNNEEDTELSISMGLHPYFKVSDEEKRNIKFNFEGGKLIEEQTNIWMNEGTVYIDNPKVKNSEATLDVDIPKLGHIILDISPEYQKIWVWSVPGKDFICVEPMMSGLNGLIDNPEKIKPDGSYIAKINIKLIEN